MLYDLTQLMLIFCKEIILVPLIVLGFIWIDRRAFYNATCLLLLSIILNFTLKIIFKIPLSPMVGKNWYAFPSGHMQATTVFYGSIAYSMTNPLLRLLLIVLLVGIGCSLIYCGYHNYIDILGAIVTAILLITLYYYTSLRLPVMLPWLTLLLATVLMFYIYLNYQHITEHLYKTFYLLFGFVLSEKIFNKKLSLKPIRPKILATILCFASFFIIHFVFAHKLFKSLELPLFFKQLPWLIIGFIIPFSTFFSTKLLTKHN